MESWWLWEDGERSPFENMAIDELLLSSQEQLEAMPLIRIYGWDRPSVSIGYVQNYDAAPAGGYTVVRRPTGGGVVFHDHDLTYTIVVPESHPICQLDRIESYHVFHRAILKALAELGISGELAPDQNAPVDRAVMQCFTTPTRYDVLGDGRKLAGAAQRRTRDGILHQGSISLDASGGNRLTLAQLLKKVFASEFNIDFKNFVPGSKLLSDAAAVAAAKYASAEWNKRRNSTGSEESAAAH